ncbi:hypothetical protein RHMOL_Rhmol11G0219900 [Rhododendron molle]|uniref:Uncharacterized protein n=1 Tax=Rhododendron molle TaxID=49168 RepID=A0ACC0LVW1_RHOML|nr:hypothetical protein RHMOL_Rhmol11G0219900 [Rhododendron molle]
MWTSAPIDHGRRFSSMIDHPEKLYKTDQITAEMKNSVLKTKVMPPKVKEEERSDMFLSKSCLLSIFIFFGV